MQSNISEILKRIETLQRELGQEYERLLEKYEYKIEQGRVTFLETIRKRNALLKNNLVKYIFTADFRHVLSMPFIYSMIFPMWLLDLFLFIYQTFAFPLYGLPKVRRSEYIVYDRQFLDYLNLAQKFNCLYCTYGNGLFAYAVEIASRTERYWCPIKAARHPKAAHSYYKDFADYGDPEGFFEVANSPPCFDPPPDSDVSRR